MKNLKTIPTMRLLRFLAVISLLLLPEIGRACYYPWYYCSSPALYRVEQIDESAVESKKMANLRDWQQMTSLDIPIDDIERVVYTMTLEEYEALCAVEHYTGSNMFARWIKENDPAIMEFLLLAKRNEFVRFGYNSLWYYPTMKVGGPMTLEEIIDVSLNTKDERLRSRYMLQAMRAMYTLCRYDECIELWEREFESRPMEDTMRRHAYLYIAGALYHTGEVDKAIDMYAEAGDINSILYIAQLEGIDISKVELLERLYRNNPNNPTILERVVNIVYEDEGPIFFRENGYEEHVLSNNSRELLDMSLRLASEGRDAAIWYYTAAYIYYLEGRLDDADRTLMLAEHSHKSPFMSESIEVLRIIIDAHTAKLDKRYEQRLLKQLTWLEEKNYAYIDGVDMNYTSSVSFYVFPTGLYYWKSSMQYLINEILVPRYQEAGNGVRALQLANYSSYFLLRPNTSIHESYYDSDNYEWIDMGYDTLNDYRHFIYGFNALDYSTFFFSVVDTSDIDDVLAYVEGANTPNGELERLLNRGSYLDRDFLYDIAGTHCLRNMRYAEAERYLNEVDYYYSNYGLNVSQKYDPFEFERVRKRSGDFRLDFAREMASLERAMDNATNSNVRARYMIRYAIGLKNSFTRCWELTHYYYGYVPHTYDTHSWWSDAHTKVTIGKANAMVQEALSIIDDRELAAEMHYMFGNFRTVALDYPDTYYGDIVRTQCDHLNDYDGHCLDKHW